MIRLSFYDFSNMTRIRLNRLHCIMFIRFVKKKKWKNSESLNTVYIYIYEIWINVQSRRDWRIVWIDDIELARLTWWQRLKVSKR